MSDRTIVVNDREAYLVNYFKLEALNISFIIYTFDSPKKDSINLYIGEIKRDEVDKVTKEMSYIIQSLLKEIINSNYMLVKAYRYFILSSDDLEEKLKVIDNQKMVITKESYEKLLENIKYITKNNDTLIETGKEEYYLSLAEQYEKKKDKFVIAAGIIVIIGSVVAIILIIGRIL